MQQLIIHLVHPVDDKSVLHFYMQNVVPDASIIDGDGDVVFETLQGTRYYIPRENVAMVEMPMLHAAHADIKPPQGGTDEMAT